MTIASFEQLLKEFSVLPTPPQREVTFLDVIGYGRREVPISNCLAWFFNSSEEGHGLGTALAQALFECARHDADDHVPSVARLFDADPGGIEYCRVDTEVGAPDSEDRMRRIDILLETKNAVVAIEHKIDAALYNNLDAYLSRAGDAARDVFNDKSARGCAGIVLAPRAHRFAERAHESKFVVVDYDAFVQRALLAVSPHILSMPPRAWSILKEVLDTMRTISSEPDDAELRVFLEQHEQQIGALLSERSKIRGYLRSRAKEIARLALASSSLNAPLVGNGIWKPDGECVAVPWFDIGISESRRLRLDVSLRPTKTEFVWSVRSSIGVVIADQSEARQILADAGIEPVPDGRYSGPERFVVGEPMATGEDALTVADRAVGYLNRVAAAIGTP